jgi:glycerol-3-phosphate acyltransferase PlsY
VDGVIAVALGYLAGSIPFAFLLASRYGVDLRRAGSGNVGASNVLRTSGVASAVSAMCLDAVKGGAAVLVAERLTVGPAAPVAAGLAAILGHVYPVWLGFRGGKGVAPAAGVFGVLAPQAMLVAVAVFLVTVWSTRYISAGSLAGAVALAVATAASDASGPVIAGAAVAALIVVHRHRDNLARLMSGTERRVGQRLF